MSDTLTMSDAEILDQIQREVAENRVFLYMKGTPGAAELRLLEPGGADPEPLGAEYGARDILADPRIRQVLSGWSDWPTIPQLFVDGKLVGGCDITTEMFQDGELQELVGASSGPAARRVTRSSPLTSCSPSSTRISAAGLTPRPCGARPRAGHQAPVRRLLGVRRGGERRLVAGRAGLDVIYHLTELIQTSPEGVSGWSTRCLGGYRLQRITTYEARFMPRSATAAASATSTRS